MSISSGQTESILDQFHLYAITQNSIIWSKQLPWGEYCPSVTYNAKDCFGSARNFYKASVLQGNSYDLFSSDNSMVIL